MKHQQITVITRIDGTHNIKILTFDNEDQFQHYFNMRDDDIIWTYQLQEDLRFILIRTNSYDNINQY